MIPDHYLVVSDRPWGRYAFEQAKLPDNWHFISHLDVVADALFVPANEAKDHIRYIFFVHWSKKVTQKITDNFEAVNFHMTDLPYGRGGSPLQNLVAAGNDETVITAHRMTQEVDAGPVYMKVPLSLAGSAEEVYLRAARKSLVMAEIIATQELTPVPQDTVESYMTAFKRRMPEQSRVPEGLSLDGLFDHIRMLDAEGYPPAFLEYDGFRFEFSRASLRTGRIVADVTIKEIDG